MRKAKYPGVDCILPVKAGYSRTHLPVINTLKCRAGVSRLESTLGADGAAVWIYFL